MYTAGTDGLLETLCCVFFILNLTEQNKRPSNLSAHYRIRTKCRTAKILKQLPLSPNNIKERVLNYLYATEEVVLFKTIPTISLRKIIFQNTRKFQD